MKKEAINENTVVEVGKKYLVRCAILTDGKGKELAVPVIGEVHNDKAFGFVHKHIHIDGRFSGKQEEKYFFVDEEGKTNHVLTFSESYVSFFIDRFEERIKLCKRLTTGIKPLKDESKSILFYKWVETMKGKSCEGKKCPHLGTKMFEEDGVLVCPLHNLISDKEQKKIIGVKK